MEDLGKIAYDAYGEARGWTVVGGGAMPSWDDQSPELREAWSAAADAVVVALTELPLTDVSLSTVAALDAAVVAHAERQRAARRTEGCRRMTDPAEKTVHVDGPCPFLTCLEDGPHDHPVCPECGAVRYGNFGCVVCRAHLAAGAPR